MNPCHHAGVQRAGGDFDNQRPRRPELKTVVSPKRLPKFRFNLFLERLRKVETAVTANRLRIAVLFGGRSAEHEVSVLSAT
ncbi:MAG: hypothetical protein E5V17_04670, partial [Mesorhizobium sp.]